MAKAPEATTSPAATDDPAPAEAVATVRMTRDADYPAPHHADVHPAEVANFAIGGWVVAG